MPARARHELRLVGTLLASGSWRSRRTGAVAGWAIGPFILLFLPLVILLVLACRRQEADCILGTGPLCVGAGPAR